MGPLHGTETTLWCLGGHPSPDPQGFYGKHVSRQRPHAKPEPIRLLQKNLLLAMAMRKALKLLHCIRSLKQVRGQENLNFRRLAQTVNDFAGFLLDFFILEELGQFGLRFLKC